MSSAVCTVASKAARLPLIGVTRYSRAGIAGCHVPPRSHANPETAILNPRAAISCSAGGGDHRHPRDAHSTAVEVKPVQRPMPTHTRIDRRAGGEMPVFTLPEDPVALVLRAGENRLATYD